MKLSELIKELEEQKKLWVKDIKAKWEPPEDLFSKGSAGDIADAVAAAHKDLQSAMASLNFYINRAGETLSAERKKTLEAAKKKLSAHSKFKK